MSAIRRLSIDIETYSDVDIKKVGLYRYAQSPAFGVLLFAYSVDGASPEVVDLTAGQAIPAAILFAMFDPATQKHAYNAAFEWYCLSRHFGLKNPEAWLPQWRCTQLHGLYCGYTRGLAATGSALGLPADQQKLSTGRALIKYFCVPCTPTKVNGGRSRNQPHHDPERWQLFKEYCAQDVVTEMAVEQKLSNFPVPDAVRAQWVTDQRINYRGVAVDLALVSAALELDAAARADFVEEAKRISGLANPNSVKALIAWLEDETDSNIPNIRKNTVSELLKSDVPTDAARRILEIRQELSKTSTKKYDAIAAAVCEDRRVRGTLQFYGARRTGRWAGRIVQPQNLPRTYIREELLPMARGLVKQRQRGALEAVFGSVSDTLSQLIRTAIVAEEGKTLIDADFSAIEARIVAWLAGEKWVLDVFKTHGKIYEATASQLYNVPIDKIKKGNPEYSLRQYGKAATLALGYAGGTSALITAGHMDKNTPESELLDIRDRWRKANPAIVRFWYTVEAAAMEAVRNGRRITLLGGALIIARECDAGAGLDFLTIQLPSGRKLFYASPHIGTNEDGRPRICYMGVNKADKWAELETYGGKLVENITQAVARDCLAEALERLDAAGYRIVFHVHDEAVVEAEPGNSLEGMIRIMREVPTWAAGLPLNADGWTNPFFKKD